MVCKSSNQCFGWRMALKYRIPFGNQHHPRMAMASGRGSVRTRALENPALPTKECVHHGRIRGCSRTRGQPHSRKTTCPTQSPHWRLCRSFFVAMICKFFECPGSTVRPSQSGISPRGRHGEVGASDSPILVRRACMLSSIGRRSRFNIRVLNPAFAAAARKDSGVK